ncbi:hypothetical protein CCACVL1_27075 [Corchorus capsularis]|uniref:Uncharacterized protein n=1 Tax=Corchorus capsularis TaxID=210143 RepID=A0A1R3GCF9_COCAP|nr:hypothetical protein CCACVL1_27075 [Corchorus capsularis]
MAPLSKVMILIHCFVLQIA